MKRGSNFDTSFSASASATNGVIAVENLNDKAMI
jgi:hypothetical protein